MNKLHKKKTYTVYIEQVNQTKYDVEAWSKEQARDIAARMWKAENIFPEIICVEE
jgi:hypothetical protein